MSAPLEQELELQRTDRRRRLAISTPYLHRMQRRHFILFNVMPVVGTLAAIGLAFVYPIGVLELSLFGVMWLLTGLGVSAGYHRLFTHGAFRAATSVRVALAVLGSMAGLGPVVSWVAMHRRHHQLADKPGDMHSPNLHGETLGGRVRGFVHAHFTWAVKHEYPNIAHYTPDLLEDRPILRVSRHYQSWVMLGLLIPAVIGGVVGGSLISALNGLLWGGIVRMFVVGQSIAALNSVLHTMGRRRFGTQDNSRNSWILGGLVWGEGWHNNHHAFPSSASFALKWYALDLSYWLIVVLERLGLATEVKRPSKANIESRDSRTPLGLATATAAGTSTEAD